VSACAAFKEAGILTHAYMIYGYWQETPQMLMDSMETLRQLFASGLLDSAFWHKFVLTRHSRAFQEWKAGLYPDLQPLGLDEGEESIFASNDLRFVGEEKSAKYGEPLNRALSAWMNGQDLEIPVTKWFPFAMPRPSVAPDIVEQAIVVYEQQRDRAYRDFNHFCSNGKDYCWLGGRPFVVAGKGGLQLTWSYMGELFYGKFPAGTKKSQAEQVALWLYNASPRRWSEEGLMAEDSSGRAEFSEEVRENLKYLYKKLRGRGLCRVF
jgi:hypothetical protein